MGNIRNKAGIRYGRLIAKEVASTDWNGHHWVTFWLCKCDCGNETIVRGNHLQSGTTKSCGCLHKEIVTALGKENIGELSNNYVDGKSCGKYTRENHELKDTIRLRDNYTCQECGKTQEELKNNYHKKLDVHHIDNNETNNIKKFSLSLSKLP